MCAPVVGVNSWPTQRDNVGAFIIRIGFGGHYTHNNYNKEAPK